MLEPQSAFTFHNSMTYFVPITQLFLLIV